MTDEYDDIPDSLKARFKALDGDVTVLTGRADGVVLGAARRQFGGSRRLTAWATGAIAASLLTAVLFFPGATELDDIDGPGTVDIVDAMLLARDGGAQNRVNAIARRAVSLGGGS